MSADLRARVESLKAETQGRATSVETVDERSATLWEWANAFALDGGMLPVYLPVRINEVARARFDGEPPPQRVLEDIDRYVSELRFKEERPDGLGKLHFTSQEPLISASWTTVEQVYRVGSEALVPGATLMLARQMMSDQGDFQHEDAAADNYISVASSNPAARFETTRVPLAGMHGAFRGAPSPTVSFRLREGRVESGETVTFTYGDRSGGSRGWQVQTFSIDGLLLPVYMDLTGEGPFLSPRWPALRVIGQPITRSVRGFVPSVVAPGESFELSVRSEDPYFNRPSGAIPAYEILLDGEPWGKVDASSSAITVVEEIALDNPGVHRFTFRTADGLVTGAANPLWVREGAPRRVFWGETHGHCGFAEGQGSADSYYRSGRDDARLDFLTLSEHDALMDDWEWKRLSELSRQYSEEGEFITFLGYEWSAQRRQGGHHNVLFRNPGRTRVPVQTHNDLALLYQGLHQDNDPEDVLIIPHAHNAADWTRNDSQLERLVEVASVHGTFEWFGNLYLQAGFEIGFIGASDDHRTNPGYGTPLRYPFLTQRAGIAAVWAEEKSTDAIFDALRSLSAYATTSERLILDVEVNGHPMGTRQEQAARREIECRVMGTSPIDHIDVIKNGEVVFTRDYLTASLEPRSWLQIGFESSSEVFFPQRDNPRPYRVWEGSVRVENASVTQVETPGFDNHYSESARVDEENENLIHFYAQTRGRMDTMLVELDGASRSSSLHFRLVANEERGSSAGNVRPPAMIPAAEVSIELSQLVDGRAEVDFGVGEHSDRIVVQVVEPEAPLDQEVRFTDLEDNQPGDYYYVRVAQLDGGLAFSSPFWVGTQRSGD